MATILIVEDEALVARIMAHFLRRAGHVPILAPDGRSALHAVSAHPDVILLDLGLPDIRGDELLRRFRSRPDTAGIPVVVISGAAEAASIFARGGADGVAAILRKPVLGVEICGVVDAVLNAHTTSDEGSAPAERQRAKLILHLILEGSAPLVFQVCRLLEAGRDGRAAAADDAPTWPNIVAWAKEEHLLDETEAELLLETQARARDPVCQGPAC
jgi:CheY-like chemotaxis protein